MGRNKGMSEAVSRRNTAIAIRGMKIMKEGKRKEDMLDILEKEYPYLSRVTLEGYYRRNATPIRKALGIARLKGNRDIFMKRACELYSTGQKKKAIATLKDEFPVLSLSTVNQYWSGLLRMKLNGEL